MLPGSQVVKLAMMITTSRLDSLGVGASTSLHSCRAFCSEGWPFGVTSFFRSLRAVIWRYMGEEEEEEVRHSR